MYCPALVDKSKAGQGTLVSISRNIIHRTKAAALVTESYPNQDKGLISLLLTVGQMSCNVQSLLSTSLIDLIFMNKTENVILQAVLPTIADHLGTRQCEIKDIKLYQVRTKIIALGWY
jgi:hypothetical protein